MFRDFDHWKKYSTSPLFAELAEGYRDKSGGNKVVASPTTASATSLEQADQQARGHEGPQDPRARRAALHDVPARRRGEPTPIAFAEVYLALQNGTVDAQENPLPTIDAKKFYEVQKYIVLTGHITDTLLAIVGGPTGTSSRTPTRRSSSRSSARRPEKANAEIARPPKTQLVTEFATKYGRTVVKSDREAFKKVFTKFHTGQDVPWDKALYDRVQAIK